MSQRSLTTGSPLRLILRFALPIVAGNALQQFYSLVDSLVIGRAEGVTALAAVAASGWLDWLVLSLAMGLTQGFAIRVAQEFGAEDFGALRRTAGQSVLLALLATAALEALSQGLLRPVLVLLASPEDTIHLTERYLRVIFAGLPLVMGVNLLGGFLRSVGDSRTPLVAMVASTLCNAVLDVLFVALLRWGVTGAALATTISQGASCVICLLAVRRLPYFRLKAEELRPDWPLCGALMRLSTPLAFGNLVISLGGLVLQRVVNGFGFVFMAGYNAASRLQGLVEMAGSSLGSAVGTFAGQNIGAGRLDRVKKGVRQSLVLSIGLALAVAALMIVFGRQLLALFIQDEPELVEQVLAYAYRFLIIMSIGLPALYILFAYRSALQGLGNTVVPMISGFLELACRIAAILLLPRLLGETGVFIAEIAAWIGAGAYLGVEYYRWVWKREEGRGRS